MAGGKGIGTPIAEAIAGTRNRCEPNLNLVRVELVVEPNWLARCYPTVICATRELHLCFISAQTRDLFLERCRCRIIETAGPRGRYGDNTPHAALVPVAGAELETVGALCFDNWFVSGAAVRTKTTNEIQDDAGDGPHDAG